MCDSDSSWREELFPATDTPLPRWQDAHLVHCRPEQPPSLFGAEYLGMLSGLHAVSLCW